MFYQEARKKNYHLHFKFMLTLLPSFLIVSVRTSNSAFITEINKNLQFLKTQKAIFNKKILFLDWLKKWSKLMAKSCYLRTMFDVVEISIQNCEGLENQLTVIVARGQIKYGTVVVEDW